MAKMSVSSPAFKDNDFIPVQYSCQGKGGNPPLVFQNVPEKTKSLLLIVDDPDAPMGTFTHWIVFNLSPQSTGIAEGQTPDASFGENTSGRINYVNPCPPPGKTHHYHFKLFALDTTLELTNGASRRQVEAALDGHVIAQADLVGLFKRQ